MVAGVWVLIIIIVVLLFALGYSLNKESELKEKLDIEILRNEIQSDTYNKQMTEYLELRNANYKLWQKLKNVIEYEVTSDLEIIEREAFYVWETGEILYNGCDGLKRGTKEECEEFVLNYEPQLKCYPNGGIGMTSFVTQYTNIGKLKHEKQKCQKSKYEAFANEYDNIRRIFRHCYYGKFPSILMEDEFIKEKQSEVMKEHDISLYKYWINNLGDFKNLSYDAKKELLDLLWRNKDRWCEDETE